MRRLGVSEAFLFPRTPSRSFFSGDVGLVAVSVRISPRSQWLIGHTPFRVDFSDDISY